MSETGNAPFLTTPEVVDAVNAAIHLRRPLLVTGQAGTGKSTLIDSVARELTLGPVLRWNVTSSSTVADALYRYDAIGRLHAQGLSRTSDEPPSISGYLRLGPLGTALAPADRPRALLIDEIDKSDLDLPNDLLNVLERGDYEIPELVRLPEKEAKIRGYGSDASYTIVDGHVQCTEFPFVLMTSNGERDFPAAFLRRCIRMRMPEPSAEQLARIVRAHLGDPLSAEFADEIEQHIYDFVERGRRSAGHLATDQLLNAVYLVTGSASPLGEDRRRVVDLLMKELTSDTI